VPHPALPHVHVGRRRSAVLAALAAGALVIGSACAGTPAPEPPADVVLVTLDATRADALSCYGGRLADTPNLDAIARESVRFDQAITTAPYTGPSHASILTGLYPPQHGLRDFLHQRMRDDVATLPELLRERGFRTAAFVSTYVLDRRFGLDRGFDVYSGDFWQKATPDGRPRPVQGSASFERPARETVDEAIAWIARAPASQPFFLWLHLFDAHAPYDPPPAARRAWPDHAEATPLERQRRLYYDEVRSMDAELARLFDALRAAGRYGRAIVVVTADHGELLGYHDGRPIETHSTQLVEATLRVPLLVRAPGRVEPGNVTKQVRVIDVPPTVLDALGIAVPPEMAGKSLLPAAWGRDAEPRPAYSETFYEHFPRVAMPGQELVSLRYVGWKLLTRPGRSELFELGGDAYALRDVSALHPGRHAQLVDVLAGLRASFPRGAHETRLDLAPGEQESHLERLRSLGYVE
jgi:arylsulfatase A-like enzyme